MKQSNMPNLFFKLLMLLAVISFFSNSCKKKEKKVDCGQYQVNINGKCQCKEGLMEVYTEWPNINSKRCETKQKGKFFLDSTDCPCFLRPKEYMLDFDSTELANPVHWSNAMNAYEISMIINYSRGGSKGSFFYFKDNDSLFDHVFMWGGLSSGDCDDNTRSFLTGKFFNNRNRLRLNVYFHNERDGLGNMSNYTSSCTMWLNNHMK
jgi:hypothetical protein